MKMSSDIYLVTYLYLFTNFQHLWAEIGNDKIWETRTVNLLSITADNVLKFDKHLLIYLLKGGKEIISINEDKKVLRFNKTKILFEGFFELQFK